MAMTPDEVREAQTSFNQQEVDKLVTHIEQFLIRHHHRGGPTSICIDELDTSLSTIRETLKAYNKAGWMAKFDDHDSHKYIHLCEKK